MPGATVRVRSRLESLVGRAARRRGSPKRDGRRRFLLEHVPLGGRPVDGARGGGRARVLEIGALDDPLLAGMRGVSVEYLDWFSRDELVRMHAGNARRNARRIVETTHVVKAKRFASAVAREFDLVVANHVLEHVPDPITWLREVDQLVVPGGAVFLALPDRRFSFDYLRPVSTVADLLRAYRADLERPDFTQVLEAIFYARPLRAGDFAGGMPPPEKLAHRPFATLADAIVAAERRTEDYSDVHCHVFEADVFPALLDDLRSAGLVRWRVAGLQDVEAGRSEFRVILRREEEDGDAGD